MNYEELEELYDQFGGKFTFAVLLQKRVAQLIAGDKRLIKVHDQSMSPVEIALAEVRAGKIWLEDGELCIGKPDSAA